MIDKESQRGIDKIADEAKQGHLTMLDMREAMLRGEVSVPEFAEAVRQHAARQEELLAQAETIAVVNGIDLGPWNDRLHGPFRDDETSVE